MTLLLYIVWVFKAIYYQIPIYFGGNTRHRLKQVKIRAAEPGRP